MDVFSGYNQIPMHPEYHEKVAFMTESGNNLYNEMPLRLKNAGTTYYCIINKLFKNQIEKMMEV